jgi:parallel beta-helix repeat protein
MKKILSLLLLIAPILCFSQAPRVTQTIGTKLTDIKVPGGIRSDSSMRPPLDTTSSAAIGSFAFNLTTNKTYQKQADGFWHELIGSVAYSAGALNIKANGSDQTALLNSVVASSVKEIWIDNGTVTISGTFNAQGKKISFKNGGKFTGSGTLTNALIDAGFLDQIFDTTLTVTNLLNSTVSVRWFGAKSDYRDDGGSITYTNNQPIFKRALASMQDLLPSVNFQYFKKLYIPYSDQNKWYALDTTFILDAAVELYGDGMERTILKFKPTCMGIWCRYPDYPGGFTFKGGRDQYLHDFEIVGTVNSYGTAQYDGKSHGVYVQTNLTVLERVQVQKMNGDGICIQANTPASNANNCLVKECRAESNSGSGIYMDGSDGNQIKIEGGDYSGNARWGYWDGSFLGCYAAGLHSASNGVANIYNRMWVSDGVNQYFCIKDVVWRVSNNGNRYRCILAHNKPTTQSITEPGVGSSWATYWVLVGPGGPNPQYLDYKNNTTLQDFTTGTIVPGVTSGWQTYWEFKSAGGYDPGTDVNIDGGIVKKYTDSTQWYTGGGYFFEDGNASGVAIGCYAEGDQHLSTNRARTLIIGGVLCNFGSGIGSLGLDLGVLNTLNIKIKEPALRIGLLIKPGPPTGNDLFQ